MSKVSSAPPKKKKSFIGRLFKFCLFLGFLGIIALLGFYFAVRQGMFGELPTRAELKAINNPVVSKLYSEDKQLLGKFYFENRSTVPYKKISSYIITALVATEDARFFDHKGVDTRSYFRVLIKTLLMRDRSSGGGSTISQQIIKNLYKRQSHGPLTMPVNKIKEAIVAVRLEDVYSKEDVIALYLNTVPFGERCFGIGAACQRFFNKKPNDVNLEEAATLIGMLKAPTAYSPRLYPEKSKTRRNTVLNLMAKKYPTMRSTIEDAKKKPLVIDYTLRSESEELAPHFRNYVRDFLKKWSKENPKSDGTHWNVFTDGLEIHTTINSKMQRYAIDAVAKQMQDLQGKLVEHWAGRQPFSDIALSNAKKASNRYKSMKKAGKSDREIDASFRKKQKMKVFAWSKEGSKEVEMTPMDSLKYYLMFLNTGFLAMEPQSGAVKAWVGSIDYDYFRHDYTRVNRQVGSTFKPIVYATAVSKGIEPCDYYKNDLRSYTDHQNWTPRNAGDLYGGFRSLKGALTESLNTITAQLIFEAGIEDVIETARDLSIDGNIPELPSIALGTAELTLQEMVHAYTAFANEGKMVEEPVFVKEIKTRDGKVIYRAPRYNTKQALARETGIIMREILEGVVDSGTARRLGWMYGFTAEYDLGGKTGTTQNQTDGWFIGFTPKLVAGSWVGADNRNVRFRSISLGAGSSMALPIWGDFMSKLREDKNFKYYVNAKFSPTPPMIAERLTCPNAVNDTTRYYPPPEPDPFDPYATNTEGDNNSTSTYPPSGGVGTSSGSTTSGGRTRDDIVVNPRKNRPPVVDPIKQNRSGRSGGVSSTNGRPRIKAQPARPLTNRPSTKGSGLRTNESIETVKNPAPVKVKAKKKRKQDKKNRRKDRKKNKKKKGFFDDLFGE